MGSRTSLRLVAHWYRAGSTNSAHSVRSLLSPAATNLRSKASPRGPRGGWSAEILRSGSKASPLFNCAALPMARGQLFPAQGSPQRLPVAIFRLTSATLLGSVTAKVLHDINYFGDPAVKNRRSPLRRSASLKISKKTSPDGLFPLTLTRRAALSFQWIVAMYHPRSWADFTRRNTSDRTSSVRSSGRCCSMEILIVSETSQRRREPLQFGPLRGRKRLLG